MFKRHLEVAENLTDESFLSDKDLGVSQFVMGLKMLVISRPPHAKFSFFRQRNHDWVSSTRY